MRKKKTNSRERKAAVRILEPNVLEVILRPSTGEQCVCLCIYVRDTRKRSTSTPECTCVISVHSTNWFILLYFWFGCRQKPDSFVAAAKTEEKKKKKNSVANDCLQKILKLCPHLAVCCIKRSGTAENPMYSRYQPLMPTMSKHAGRMYHH